MSVPRILASASPRVLGVSLDQLRKVPEVIGLMMQDARRADAAAAALRGGFVTTFVTDASVARALVEEAAA
jgi:DNA-binding transcriptional regulator LsrR (DeoR family)